jgi:nucleoside-diphosphate-sugar epimerase
VVSNFAVQATRGEPLTVHGDGSQTRSFCYVDDLAQGLLALLDSEITGPVNVGGDEERTMLEVAQLVLELSGSTAGIVFSPRPLDDPSMRCPDLTLARRELGWEPTTPFRDGLARTIEWFAGRSAR